MKIKDVLAGGSPSVSFEVFPPRKDAPFEPVKEAVMRLAQEHPSFMSVTYGAAGGAQANTVGIASFVQKCGVPALAHLTCVSATDESIAAEAASLHAAGIENVLCLRGDMPKDAATPSPGRFAHAVDLVRALKGRGFCLGGACYPECHPECEHMEDDIAHLREKVDAGLDFVTTQMFFDNNIFYRYLSKLRDRGVTVPVIAGVMPVTNGRQIARICRLSGTYLPSRFKAIVDRFGDDPKAMLDAGVAYALEQIVDLFANGINSVHIYTMNKPEVAGRIMANLRGILARPSRKMV
jgi:methylenetetrahydrofolate reductase (NADPH)